MSFGSNLFLYFLLKRELLLIKGQIWFEFQYCHNNKTRIFSNIVYSSFLLLIILLSYQQNFCCNPNSRDNSTGWSAANLAAEENKRHYKNVAAQI